jgi:arylsulfatase A-like enzyme
MKRARALLPILLTSALLACEKPPPASEAPAAQRLVTLFGADRVEHPAPAPVIPARTELRFDGAQPVKFEAGPGIAGLALRDGKLAGRTTGALAALRLALPADPPPDDFVHAVEVRLRVSAGQNLELNLRRAGPLEGDAFAQSPMLWPIAGPVVPDGELHSYTLEPQIPIASAQLREMLLSPSDVPGASFEIESVRVIFAKERLASVKSGPGWHGLSEIYRETLVARAPEVLRFRVQIPPAATLDLALGTIENDPLRFRISARVDGEETLLAERTLTQPQRWEPLRVDLTAYAGRSMELALALASERAGAIGFWGAPAVRSTAPRGGIQHVLVILADTLRRDHLDVYGHTRETAPTLARMAREGTLFRDAVSNASWTKVSVTSLMLSLYPTSHGVRSFADRLPDEASTLAEAFRDAGFATVAFSANFFVGKLTHLEQGFEELQESASLSTSVSQDAEQSKTAREQVDRLLPWLDAHRDVPFFAYLHVTDPHSPYRPMAPYDTRFASAEDGARHEREQAELRRFIAHPVMRAFGMPIASELAAAELDAETYSSVDRAWYDASIRAMDAELARVFERLRELGLAENTLVVFTSDHGEEFLEHGASFHGRSVYGEVTRVPLLFWGAGVPAGRVVEPTVQSIDLMPTLLALASVKTNAPMQGQSLAPLLGDDAAARAWKQRPAVSEHRLDLSGPPWVDREGTAIEDGAWKLIENSSPGAGVPPVELYDARRDPLDQHDVAAEHAEEVTRLRAALAAWRAEAAKTRLKSAATSEPNLSSEEIERLKSLGYVQ